MRLGYSFETVSLILGVGKLTPGTRLRSCSLIGPHLPYAVCTASAKKQEGGTGNETIPHLQLACRVGEWEYGTRLVKLFIKKRPLSINRIFQYFVYGFLTAAMIVCMKQH